MYAKILEVLERVVCEEARLKEAADGTSNAADGAVDGLRTAGAGIRGC